MKAKWLVAALSAVASLSMAAPVAARTEVGVTFSLGSGYYDPYAFDDYPSYDYHYPALPYEYSDPYAYDWSDSEWWDDWSAEPWDSGYWEWYEEY